MRVSNGRNLGWLVCGLAIWIPVPPALAQANTPRTALPLPPPTTYRPATNAANRVLPRAATLATPATPVTPLAPTRVVNATPVAAPEPQTSILTPLISPFAPPAPQPAPITTGLPGLSIAPAPTSTGDVNAVLKWDAESKEHKAKAGETSTTYTFWLTNVSSSEVLVNRVSTSCGCTVAQLPSQPWPIPPGGGGPIHVTLNMVGKVGLITKGVTVDTTAGVKQLTVKADIPVPPGGSPAMGVPVVASGMMNDGERMQNMQMALADRQVVFKNKDCAKCHADPAQGKTEGRLVYVAVCATCHNSHLRAAMVPDLRALKHPTDAEFWRKWITYGRAGSMMPAFAASEGGPLNEQQVNALVDFMVKAFPSRAQPTQASPASAPASRPTASLSPGVQSSPVAP